MTTVIMVRGTLGGICWERSWVTCMLAQEHHGCLIHVRAGHSNFERAGATASSKTALLPQPPINSMKQDRYSKICTVLRRVLCSTICMAALSDVFGEFCAVLRRVLCSTICSGVRRWSGKVEGAMPACIKIYCKYHGWRRRNSFRKYKSFE